MKTIIGVRFKTAGKLYYFDPGDSGVSIGDGVIVETARGLEYGEVVTGPHGVEENLIVQPLKGIVRVATDIDKMMLAANKDLEKEAFRICEQKIAEHRLDMKLVGVEYSFNGAKVTFYFTAEGRVDFRELVKDLASVFKTRIELRQIGVRDEAKMLGGIGPCGRVVCCHQFLGDFHPVSIKMAKEQSLSLSPTKISGLCGRLMCCLKYEQDAYEQTRKRMPRVGREVMTPDGRGTVTDINVITEHVKVKIIAQDDTIDIRDYSLDKITQIARDKERPQREKRARSEESDGSVIGTATDGQLYDTDDIDDVDIDDLDLDDIEDELVDIDDDSDDNDN